MLPRKSWFGFVWIEPEQPATRRSEEGCCRAKRDDAWKRENGQFPNREITLRQSNKKKPCASHVTVPGCEFGTFLISALNLERWCGGVWHIASDFWSVPVRPLESTPPAIRNMVPVGTFQLFRRATCQTSSHQFGKLNAGIDDVQTNFARRFFFNKHTGETLIPSATTRCRFVGFDHDSQSPTTMVFFVFGRCRC